MQNTKIRRLAILGFVLAAAFIFGSTFYMYIHLQAFTESTSQVQRSLQTEQKLGETLSLVTDSETGPRGYVIMGQEVFLEPYFAAISPTDGIIPRLKELRQLTLDNPRQQQQLDQLELLVAEKLRFMQNLVEVRRNAGFDAAKELIATDIGRQAMVNVSRQLQAMRNAEALHRQQSSDEASAELQNTITAMITGLGSGIALLLFSFLVVNREVGHRKQAEEALQQLNSELNVRIDERVQALQKSEQGFRLLVESVKDYAIFMLDTDGAIMTWNTGAELLTGYTAQEMTGQNYSLFFTPEDLAAGTPARYLKTALEHERLEDESWRVRKDGTRFLSDVVMTPVYDDHRQLKGFAKVIRDITLRKQNEMRIEHLNRLYATLSQINETLVRVKEKEELFPSICRVTVESGKFGLAWIGLLDPVSGTVTPAVTYGKGAQSIPVVSSNRPEAPVPPDLISSAVATGKVVACKNIQTDPAMQPWRAMAIANGFHSAASVPIRQGSETVALLNLFSADMEMFTDQAEIHLLQEISSDVSFALDTLHLSELQKETQESLLLSEQRFRDMFEGHSAIMLVIDPETGFILEANKAAIAFYGWSIDDMRKLRIQDINTLSPEEVQTAIEQSKSGEKNYFLFRHRRADGSIRDIEAYSRTIVSKERSALHTIIHDVTDRKHYQLTTELHIALLEMVGNHSIEELLQVTLDKAELLTESSIGFFHFVSDDQTSLSLQAWSTNTKKHMCTAVGEGSHYAIDSAGVWADAARQKKAIIHNDYAALKNRKGMPEGHAAVTREVVVPVIRAQKVVAILGVGNKGTPYDEQDIRWISIVADIAWDIVAKKMGEDERKLLQAQKYAIELLAMHDALTGLPNRRLFSERIKLTIALCERSKTIAALLMFDLDKFKPVNDTYGHEIGDLLLQEVSNRTLAILQRSSDTLARLGGDEFVVLLPKIEALSNAEAVAEKIRKALAEPFLIEGHTLSISCSIGIAIIPDHGQTELTIMKNADDAMYLSKSHGRNCFTVYRP